MEEGDIEQSQWTVANIISRVFHPAPGIGGEIKKFLHSLSRHGADDVKERIQELAKELGLVTPVLEIDAGAAPTSSVKRKKTGGSVFSKLSMIMSDSD
jgi:hypothetical protein